jgi:hypothetical protein
MTTAHLSAPIHDAARLEAAKNALAAYDFDPYTIEHTTSKWGHERYEEDGAVRYFTVVTGTADDVTQQAQFNVIFAAGQVLPFDVYDGDWHERA